MDLETFYTDLSKQRDMPVNHVKYLQKLKASGFEPKVIYDIGCCVLHWTYEALDLWPNATYVLFDANEATSFLYKPFLHYTGVLSDEDNKVVKFYQNDKLPTGSSYYREVFFGDSIFPPEKYIEKKTRTLDSVVAEYGFPKPDFIKIDVQGSEKDVVKGGINTIKNAERLIVEMQHVNYNENAPLYNVTLPYIETSCGFTCTDPLFQCNGPFYPDGDYGFVRNDLLTSSRVDNNN